MFVYVWYYQILSEINLVPHAIFSRRCSLWKLYSNNKQKFHFVNFQQLNFVVNVCVCYIRLKLVWLFKWILQLRFCYKLGIIENNCVNFKAPTFLNFQQWKKKFQIHDDSECNLYDPWSRLKHQRENEIHFIIKSKNGVSRNMETKSFLCVRIILNRKKKFNFPFKFENTADSSVNENCCTANFILVQRSSLLPASPFVFLFIYTIRSLIEVKQKSFFSFMFIIWIQLFLRLIITPLSLCSKLNFCCCCT